jgi:hypothetical protein
MESYTEGLLRDKLREVKVLVVAFNSRLIAEELRLPDSESNNESFRKLKYRHAAIIVNTERLAKADWKRQERKLRMPQEDFNSAVLADLVKSRDLLAQLKEVFEDLERLKAFAKRQEQIDKMVMSNLERLRMEPSSVRISKNSLQKMADLRHPSRFPREMLLLVQASRRRRSTRLRSGFTFER